jgi:D-glucosaminate-6-phosphate ammonia-lyase
MNIYEKYGIQPVINASGSVTRLGGALMPSKVLSAFSEAAKHSVPIDQLQAAASQYLSTMTGTEAGLVTCGAASGLTLGTAAMLAGYDLAKMEKLPFCDGMPNEVIVAREHRSGYDHAVRAAGAFLVEVGFNEITANAGVRRTAAWEFEQAINTNTVGIFFVYTHQQKDLLNQVVEIAHNYNLPVLVDAAAELPPIENLKSIPATGADLVVFSGGKAIRGPQGTGILCGKRELITSAALQMLDMDEIFELWDAPSPLFNKAELPGLPRHGIGRGFKVSKEEIVALLTALEMFSTGVYQKQKKIAKKHLTKMKDCLVAAFVDCKIITDFEKMPELEISISETKDGISAFELCRKLRSGSPPIYVYHGDLFNGKLIINTMDLDEKSIEIISQRIYNEINSTRRNNE